MFSVIQVSATPLTLASQEGQNDAVQLLLDRGAHVDHPNKVPAFLLSKRLANSTSSVGQILYWLEPVCLCDVNSPLTPTERVPSNSSHLCKFEWSLQCCDDTDKQRSKSQPSNQGSHSLYCVHEVWLLTLITVCS